LQRSNFRQQTQQLPTARQRSRIIAAQHVDAGDIAHARHQ
jgi:hypothetical protein